MAHGLALGGLVLFAHLGWILAPSTPAKTREVQAVGVRAISADEWAQNRGEEEQPKAKDPARTVEVAKPKKEKDREPEKMPDGQVVDVAPGNGEEDPDADYVAESSNKVERETRSKDQTAFYRNAQPRRTTTVPDEQGGGSDDRQSLAGNNGTGDDDRPVSESKEQQLAIEVPDIKAREELKLEQSDEGAGPAVANRTESAEVHGNADRLRLQDGDPSASEDGSLGKMGQKGALNLTPSIAVLDVVSGAAPNDHLGDLEEGEGTFLNTREWKYASFFNRVKQSIGMHWNPGRELRQRDPTGNVYGARDRHTVLQVTLDERGRVKDVWVQKSCGLDFLDLEAVQSFERAQPFPNPPAGMLSNEDSTVSFSFGFFVDMGGIPRMRMFRQN